jgi:hypothetical protein
MYAERLCSSIHFLCAGFNPQTEKLYAERTGTSLPSASDREKETIDVQASV